MDDGVARDSGFGDDYFRHPGLCDDLHFPTDGEAELRPISRIPLNRRWSMDCRYWLFEDGRPFDPKPDDEFMADCDAMAVWQRDNEDVAKRGDRR